jgi:penicillin-binding protein 1A
VLTLAGVFLYLDPLTPKAETYRNVQLETPLRIYTREGDLLAEFGERRLIPVTLDQVPQAFIDALLDTEDKRFYEHSGIDFISLTNDTLGLVRSLMVEGSLGPGASTITMQLARNVSFGLERTFIRKFKEMLLALKIERELSKDEILELYINIVPFGKRAYGAEAAARTYYGKPLMELDLAQLAMLAGIPQAPSSGNPINGPERAQRRRNVVLSRMYEQGSISHAAYREATEAPITARIYERAVETPAPHAAEWVRRQLIYTYPDLYTGGYEVSTTIGSTLQNAATAAVRRGLQDFDVRHGYRGAEAKLELPAVAPDDGDSARAAVAAAVDALRGYQPAGDLEAAVVLQVTDDAARLVVGDGSFVTLDLDGVRWARPFLDIDRRGPEPASVSEVLQVGDVVRVSAAAQESGDTVSWRLAQAPDIEGALISVDPETGRILAMVGSYDFSRNQFNHALQAARQPGSGFKPFVYAAALANGVTPASVYMDAPLVFNDENLETEYRPDNNDNRYNGPTRLREALYRSINLVSMRVLLDVEAGPVIDYVTNFGFDPSSFPRNTQLAIGGGTMAVTPMQMVTAYSVFANGGFLITPHLIETVRDRDGVVLFESSRPAVCRECELMAPETASEEAPAERDLMAEAAAVAPDEPDTTGAPTEDPTGEAAGPESPEPAPRVIDARIAYLMDNMLKDVITRGTGRKALVLNRRDLAGKTGTTNDAADTWFNGYGADVATTVWVGFSNYAPLGRREFGSTTPLPIWIDYMQQALKDRAERNFPQPDGIVTLKVHPETGEAVPPGDPQGMFEYFLSEHAPQPPSSTRQSRPSDEVKAVDLF